MANDWITSNRLLLNNKKTQHLAFETNNAFQKDSVKLLGTRIDNKLTWEEHICYLARKLNQAHYQISENMLSPAPPRPSPPPEPKPLKPTNGFGYKTDVFREINKGGFKLKKTVTVDKSGPYIPGKVNSIHNNSNKNASNEFGSSSTNTTSSNQTSATTSNGVFNFGDIFAGGMPTLKPTGLRPKEKLNLNRAISTETNNELKEAANNLLRKQVAVRGPSPLPSIPFPSATKNNMLSPAPPRPSPPPEPKPLKPTNGFGYKTDVFREINKGGFKLKKTVTVDKSGPYIPGKVNSIHNNSNKNASNEFGSSSTNTTSSNQTSATTSNGVFNFGDIFAGGMPTLKPTGLRPKEKLNLNRAISTETNNELKEAANNLLRKQVAVRGPSPLPSIPFPSATKNIVNESKPPPIKFTSLFSSSAYHDSNEFIMLDKVGASAVNRRKDTLMNHDKPIIKPKPIGAKPLPPSHSSILNGRLDRTQSMGMSNSHTASSPLDNGYGFNTFRHVSPFYQSHGTVDQRNQTPTPTRSVTLPITRSTQLPSSGSPLIKPPSNGRLGNRTQSMRMSNSHTASSPVDNGYGFNTFRHVSPFHQSHETLNRPNQPPTPTRNVTLPITRSTQPPSSGSPLIKPPSNGRLGNRTQSMRMSNSHTASSALDNGYGFNTFRHVSPFHQSHGTLDRPNQPPTPTRNVTLPITRSTQPPSSGSPLIKPPSNGRLGNRTQSMRMSNSHTASSPVDNGYGFNTFRHVSPLYQSHGTLDRLNQPPTPTRNVTLPITRSTQPPSSRSPLIKPPSNGRLGNRTQSMRMSNSHTASSPVDNGYGFNTFRHVSPFHQSHETLNRSNQPPTPTRNVTLPITRSTQPPSSGSPLIKPPSNGRLGNRTQSMRTSNSHKASSPVDNSYGFNTFRHVSPFHQSHETLNRPNQPPTPTRNVTLPISRSTQPPSSGSPLIKPPSNGRLGNRTQSMRMSNSHTASSPVDNGYGFNTFRHVSPFHQSHETLNRPNQPPTPTRNVTLPITRSTQPPSSGSPLIKPPSNGRLGNRTQSMRMSNSHTASSALDNGYGFNTFRHVSPFHQSHGTLDRPNQPPTPTRNVTLPITRSTQPLPFSSPVTKPPLPPKTDSNTSIRPPQSPQPPSLSRIALPAPTPIHNRKKPLPSSVHAQLSMAINDSAPPKHKFSMRKGAKKNKSCTII